MCWTRTNIPLLHSSRPTFERTSHITLAPSTLTFKGCELSLPYLIYIAVKALSDLIGLTRLSWVSLLVLPNLCGERAFPTACLESFPSRHYYYITLGVICQEVFEKIRDFFQVVTHPHPSATRCS